MKATYFINIETGEITKDHGTAVNWNRNGDAVDVYDEKGQRRITWETPEYLDRLRKAYT